MLNLKSTNTLVQYGLFNEQRVIHENLEADSIMAPLTVLLYCYRLPHLSPQEFKTYCEETHVPFIKSLLGPDHATARIRYYTNKDAGYMVGSASPNDPDLIAIIEYESEEAMQRGLKVRRLDGIKDQMRADEDKFMDRSKLKVIVLGEGNVGLG